MASNLGQSGMAEDEFQHMFRRIQQEGGFVEFARENFPQAKELFLMSGLDVREVSGINESPIVSLSVVGFLTWFVYCALMK